MKVLKKLKQIKTKKAKKTIKFILFYFSIFLALIIIFSTNWAVENYRITNFDEVLYTLNNSISSASNEIIYNFIKENILIPLAITIIIMIIIKFIKKLFKNTDVSISIKARRKKVKFNFYKLVTLSSSVIILLYSIYYLMDNLYIFDYIKNNSVESNFFEANYIDPNKVELEFPKKKRNLIYIYAESMETTYTNVENGGGFVTDFIPELTILANNNINFSKNASVGGAHVSYNASWTMAGIVANTAGIPLETIYGATDGRSYDNGLVPGAVSLGDILKDEGYNQYIMVGSDLTFGGRRAYFQTHGNYNVFDYYTAIDDELIDDDYYVFWGYEDQKLFDYAKQKLKEISKKDEPFNFTMLTVDTHAPDGYTDKNCETVTNDKYLNSIACSSKKIYDFIEWVKKQDFYENTTIIVVGDHLSMNNYSFDSLDENYERRVYNVFINSIKNTECNKNRDFTTFDFFPTTLASLGVKIRGDRLGLGTDLFSCKETLSEKYGNNYIDNELQKKSNYYEDCINNTCN